LKRILLTCLGIPINEWEEAQEKVSLSARQMGELVTILSFNNLFPALGRLRQED
jgi:hypothetical protein